LQLFRSIWFYLFWIVLIVLAPPVGAIVRPMPDQPWKFLLIALYSGTGVALVFGGSIWLCRQRICRCLRDQLRAAGIPVCMECGYDLRGDDSGMRCPECGSPFDDAAARRATEAQD
jgi:hypothetical protein